MDDREKKNIFDAAVSVTLTEKERAVLRRAVSAYVLEHPKRFEDEREPEHRAWLVSWSVLSRPLPAALLATFLVSAGTSISFAAERSLPGDTLWPVKVSINENVRLAVAFSPEAKAAWEAKRVLRRLEEAEEMVREASFDTEARVSVESHLDDHAERVRLRIAELTTKGKVQAAAELSSNFEAALRAHGSILANLAIVASTTHTGKQDDIEELRKSVNAHKEDASAKRNATEEELSTNVDASRIAAEARMQSALKKISEVRSFIARREPAFTPNSILDAEARLVVASSMVAHGKAKLDEGNTKEAFRLFQQAHRIAEEAKLLMNARQNLNIDIRLDSASDDEEGRSDDKNDTEKSGGNELESEIHNDDNKMRDSSGLLQFKNSTMSRVELKRRGILRNFRTSMNP